MNYELMSDFEISSQVTSVIFNCEYWEINGSDFYHCGADGDGYHIQPILDYCNNPSDAWPIIIENNISMVCLAHGEYRLSRGLKNSAQHKNPLRAAMIVFLMMQE